MLRWNRFSRATKPNRSAINFTQPTSKRPERFQTTSIGFTTRLDCIHRLITRARSTSNRAVRSNQPSKHPERQDASFTFPLRSVHCQLFVGNSSRSLPILLCGQTVVFGPSKRSELQSG